MTNSQRDGLDPTDPVGAWRAIRDANLDAWAKGMATMANTESFANALGLQLDSMLATSGPIQKAVSEYMESYLAQANMPSRAEIVSLAQRMTSIEMRLDDMDARLDDIFNAVRAVALPAPAVDPRLDDILSAVRALATAKPAAKRVSASKPASKPASASKSAPRRSPKAATSTAEPSGEPSLPSDA
jgi:polyhydroxyalkanoic acid synthase PhaR subunit